LLELAILGLLKEQELHGYELKKRLGEVLGPLSSASFGSLYPALRRLETAGAVKAVEAREPLALRPIPMTGSLGGELAAFRARSAAALRGGRTKKVYGITSKGEQLFEELLTTDAVSDDDRTFNLKLAFAGHLPPDARLVLLERRRAQLVERLAKAKGAFRSRRDRLDSYARALMEHGTETTEHDISWLDRLIAAERRDNEEQKEHS
jgi:DNA-binding PadR family transcriptional regulator